MTLNKWCPECASSRCVCDRPSPPPVTRAPSPEPVRADAIRILSVLVDDPRKSFGSATREIGLPWGGPAHVLAVQAWQAAPHGSYEYAVALAALRAGWKPGQPFPSPPATAPERGGVRECHCHEQSSPTWCPVHGVAAPTSPPAPPQGAVGAGLDLDAFKRNDAGWAGEFRYLPKWSGDNGGPMVANVVEFDAGIYYSSDWSEFDLTYPLDDATLISDTLDEDVARALVERLNAPTPLIAEVERLRASLATAEARVAEQAARIRALEEAIATARHHIRFGEPGLADERLALTTTPAPTTEPTL